MSAPPAVGRLPRLSAVLPLRFAAVGAVLMLVGAADGHYQPHTICPFRALTGIPCPFCGGTTAASDLGRGHFHATVSVSPLAVGLLFALPFTGAVSRPQWWTGRRWLRAASIVVVLMGSEAWQLTRLHLL